VRRDGAPMTFAVTPQSVGRYEIGELGLGPVERPQIVEVNAGSAAAKAGMQRGDVILAVGGEKGLMQPEILKRIIASEGRPMAFTLERNGEVTNLSVAPDTSSGRPMLGVIISYYEVRRVDPTLGQALKLSAEQNWQTMVMIGRTMKGLFEKDGTPVRQLVGPIGMAELSGTAAQLGWQALFGLMAMISLNLGLLNLLPVPVLDGGHIAILAVEGLARRDISMKIKERMLLAGAAVIVLLMVTVIYNDIARYFR
jgi:regulator of sigma E protease